MHKGSISIYFRFSFVTPSDRSQRARQRADKPVTSVFLISQQRKSYQPSKNRAICTSVYLLCVQRFYLSPVSIEPLCRR